MGTTPLRSFLQSLCNNSCWNYAVFWKLHQQDQMFLTWEDGHFDNVKEQGSVENVSVDTNFEGLNETSSHGTHHHGARGETDIELAVAYMSSVQYALGEGVVGDVAYTGNHRWVFSESKSSGEFNDTFSEHAYEWLLQFAAGVKTILLVPVFPHGVIQLGSSETISEDAAVAAYIKDDFFAHQDFMAFTPIKNLDDLPSLMMDSETLLHLEEEIRAVSYGNSSNMCALGEYPDRPIWSEIPMKRPFVNERDKENLPSYEQREETVLSFPKECELHKALLPAFMGKGHDSFSGGNEGNVVNLSGDVFTSFDLGENSCIETVGGSLPTRNPVGSAHLSENMRITESSSPSATSYEGVITEEGGRKRGYDSPHHRKGSKPLVGNKRRGGKQKARPRDRQLIQDRLKELREHVPDGAKCSIDGLLDRTVRHMLFLKSVSDRAVKLRRCVRPTKTPERKPSSRNGASWAFEFEGDKKVCPIIVEDLQDPGHMIIEMICDESGRFFEIAEVIHGLELTILKGVMETRSGDTWAHFVIEGPRGLHRLDIFWPLMKLLQQQHSPISSKV